MNGAVTEVVQKSDCKDYPIIVTFQNGTFLKKKKGVKTMVEVTPDEQESQLKKVKISAETGVEYEGTEELSAVGNRTFLVVRKARTGEMKMLEVGRASLLNSVLATKKDIAASGTDYASRNSALQKMFGGKKGIRRMEKSEKFKVNASTNEESLLSSVAHIEVREEAKSAAQQMDDSLVALMPPCHRDAQHVSQVYSLPEIVGQDLLDSLEDIAIHALTENERLNSYTKAVVVSSQASIKLGAAAATALLLADATVHFVRMKSPELRRRDCKFSELGPVHEKIVELFCQRSGNALLRSLSMRDKAVAYCMAIGFVVGGQVIHLDLLAQDTGYHYRKLTQLCRAVGGVPKERGSPQCVLKLPLPSLPTLSVGRRTSSK